MTNTVISYPIPPYQNVPIQAQNYKPSRFIISAIALGQETTVTTSVNHNYVIGQSIRLVIPPKYGAYYLNGKSALVIDILALDEVLLNINSMLSDAFIPNPTFVTFDSQTQPQILAIGDYNSGQINSNGRVNLNLYIPGSFQNISPQ